MGYCKGKKKRGWKEGDQPETEPQQTTMDYSIRRKRHIPDIQIHCVERRFHLTSNHSIECRNVTVIILVLWKVQDEQVLETVAMHLQIDLEDYARLLKGVVSHVEIVSLLNFRMWIQVELAVSE